jgi:uncharacterized protein
MPFVIARRGSQWCVFTQGPGGGPQGETHGCHETRKEALAQMAALYVHVPEARGVAGPYERKAWEGDLRVEDEAQGVVHAVVSVFGNVDAEDDLVHPGAFAKEIAAGRARGRFPPGVWSHDWKSPVARTMDAREEGDGLHVIGQFNLETQRGRETFSDIKAGIIDQYSFGYRAIDPETIDGVRHLKELRWYEWSPVLHGMNEATYTVGVKRLLGDGLPLEEYLDALGDEAEEALRRVTARAELRAKEGRVMSRRNRERLASLAEALEGTSAEVRAFLAEMEPQAALLDARTINLLLLDQAARAMGEPGGAAE